MLNGLFFSAKSPVKALALQLPTKSTSGDRLMTYRINLPILAIASRDRYTVVISIPPGRIVNVLGPAEDKRFVIAGVGGERVDVFAADLADRSVCSVLAMPPPVRSLE